MFCFFIQICTFVEKTVSAQARQVLATDEAAEAAATQNEHDSSQWRWSQSIYGQVSDLKSEGGFFGALEINKQMKES